MSKHGSNHIWACFGRKGSGKSTMTSNLIALYRKRNPRAYIIIVIDYLGDYELEIPYERIPLQDLCLCDSKTIVIDLNLTFERAEEDKSEISREKFASQFTETILLNIKKLMGSLVVIDELDYLETVNGANAPKKIYDMINYGRHLNTSVLIASRRPQSIPKFILSQCDKIFVGQLTAPAETDYFKEFGFDPAELVKLSRGEFLVLDTNFPALGIRKVKSKPFTDKEIT